MSADLAAVLDGLLAYARLKATYSPDSARMLDALTSIPAAAGTAQPARADRLGCWLAGRPCQPFYGTAGLGAAPHLISALRKLDDAFAVLRSCHLTADTLIAAATNDPHRGGLVSGLPVRRAVPLRRSRLADRGQADQRRAARDAARRARRLHPRASPGTDILTTLGIAADRQPACPPPTTCSATSC